nr:SprT family zinc-dependent metalloprotease [Thiorhodococcus minor]
MNNEIAYEVIRSQRATADIVIERDGSVVVRAPEWADDDQVARIVRSKEYWIYKTLAEWRDLNAAAVLREYKNGAAFLYLGRAYRLSLVDGQDAPLQLKNGRFLLRRELVAAGDARLAKLAFQDFFRAKGRLRLGDRVRYYAPKVGVEPLGVEVKELGHRWASCSPGGKLHFHWKCMMAPQTVIDYIVVHELCHLHHRDHGDAFWNEVDKVLPDFRERKEWLRRQGAALEV